LVVDRVIELEIKLGELGRNAKPEKKCQANWKKRRQCF